MFINLNDREANNIAKNLINSTYGATMTYSSDILKILIKDIKFNDPATIVFWRDGTKTVVKTQNGEKFDPEKGMALAIIKGLFYKNAGRYYNFFKQYTENYYKSEDIIKNEDVESTKHFEPIKNLNFVDILKQDGNIVIHD